VETIRSRVQHAMLATVFLAQGTPMLLAGDEFGRTQHGNNNAYCQDNETSWIDWNLAQNDAGRALSGFVARLIALRHAHPVLRCANFLHGREEPAPGILDIAWFDEEGQSIDEQDWRNPQAHLLVLRRASKGADGQVDVITAFFNAAAEDRSFRLPPPSMPTTIILDSAEPMASRRIVEGDSLLVRARSLVLTQSDVA
jgi:glycogen operon protein